MAFSTNHTAIDLYGNGEHCSNGFRQTSKAPNWQTSKPAKASCKKKSCWKKKGAKLESLESLPSLLGLGTWKAPIFFDFTTFFFSSHGRLATATRSPHLLGPFTLLVSRLLRLASLLLKQGAKRRIRLG